VFICWSIGVLLMIRDVFSSKRIGWKRDKF
jgi:hypothetical protein